MENEKIDISAINAELQEMVKQLRIYNLKHPKKSPPKVKRLSDKKMAFIDAVYKIALENPALVMEAIDPGKFIQGVRDMKDMERLAKRAAELQQLVEDELAKMEGTMTQTTSGTS